MKVEVNVPRRWAYAVLIMLLFGSGVFAVWAYKSDYTAAGTESVEPVADVAKLGHSPNEIEVNLGTGTGTCEGKRTLQYAIANKCLGSGGGSGGFTNFKVFDNVRDNTWQVPAGVTKVMVEAWGGGEGGCGGGGAYVGEGGNVPHVSDGGEGGDYAKGIFSVSPGAYKVYVGRGGAKGIPGTPLENLDCPDGESSTFGPSSGSVLLRAAGGFSGQVSTPIADNIVYIEGQLKYTAASEGDGWVRHTMGGSSPLGGSGGEGGVIGRSGASFGSSGYPGIVPGGGGGGGGSGTLGGSEGGKGAQGRVIVWW